MGALLELKKKKKRCRCLIQWCRLGLLISLKRFTFSRTYQIFNQEIKITDDPRARSSLPSFCMSVSVWDWGGFAVQTATWL